MNSKNVDTSKAVSTEDIARAELNSAEKKPWVVTPWGDIRQGRPAPQSATEAYAAMATDAMDAFGNVGESIRRPDGSPTELTELLEQFDPATFSEIKRRAYAAAEQQHRQNGGKK